MSRRWYQLTFPAPFEAAALLQFTRSLSVRARHGLIGWSDPVVFEVESDGQILLWRLGVGDREAEQVLGALRQALPGVQLRKGEQQRRMFARAWELRVSSARRPLAADAPEQVVAGLLGALQQVHAQEAIRLQWLVGPWIHRPVVRPPKAKTDQEPLHDLGRLVVDQEQATALRKKQAEPLFGVVGRLAIRAATKGRERQLRQGVVGALQLMRAPGTGFERRLLPSILVAPRLERLSQPLINWPCVLSASELVACLGWPIGNPHLVGVSYSGSRQLPPPSEALVRGDSRHLITGKPSFPGVDGRVGLSMADAMHSMHVLGPTGTGKSTLLVRISLDAIRDGHSVVVVDGSAKNDLIRDVVDRIPSNRLDRVIVLDPSDERPIGLNVLDPRAPEQSVDSVMHIFRELYAAYWGPRTADIFHHGLTTLVQRQLTLCELPPLLLNGAFRRHVVGDLRSDALGVGPFWNSFEAWSDGERAAAVGPVLNKVRAFTQRPIIRGVVGQVDGLNLNELLNRKRVLLVGLGSLGPEAGQLLGALLLGQLWSAIQRRGAVPPERRAKALLVLDEFQRVLHLPVDLSDALVAVRGLGVGIVAAHQHLGQLRPEMRAAVLSNARSKICFQLGRDDARVMAGVLGGGLTPEDLQALDPHETYQALTKQGRSLPPASVMTLALPPSLATAAAVRNKSQKAWGRPRAEVDAALLERRQTKATSAPVGKRQRGGRS